jgi:hypothetical protein
MLATRTVTEMRLKFKGNAKEERKRGERKVEGSRTVPSYDAKSKTSL